MGCVSILKVSHAWGIVGEEIEPAEECWGESDEGVYGVYIRSHLHHSLHFTVAALAVSGTTSEDCLAACRVLRRAGCVVSPVSLPLTSLLAGGTQQSARCTPLTARAPGTAKRSPRGEARSPERSCNAGMIVGALAGAQWRWPQLRRAGRGGAGRAIETGGAESRHGRRHDYNPSVLGDPTPGHMAAAQCEFLIRAYGLHAR